MSGQRVISFLQRDRYRHVYLAGLMLFAIGLPLSKTVMSLALLLLAIHFLLGQGYRHFPTLRKGRGAAFAFFMLIVVIHLVGLLYTSDFEYALKDLRIKLPLLIIPLFMITAPPLKERQERGVMKTFLIAVLAVSLVALYRQLFLQPPDARDLTPFISHIRFSMMLCLAAVAAAHLALTAEKNNLVKTILIVLAAWFLVALVMLESLTGMLSFILILGMLLAKGIFSGKSRLITWGSVAILVILSVTGIWLISETSREFNPDHGLTYADLDSVTALGNPYYHDLSMPVNENGHLVWIYVNLKEMEEAWEERSHLAFDAKLPGGGRIADVLLRFLTSKGLRKDAEGVASLDDEEISAIERGITNYRYDQWSGMRRRIDQLKWEYWNYLEGGSSRGHSLLQRIELWQTGLSLARTNLATGVGTGDLKDEFAEQLHRQQSPLAGTPLRAHNQFITILITFGLPGLILFLAAIILPLMIRKNKIDTVYMAFLVIVLFSMLVEDTLETQVGVSFFVFFYSLRLFQNTEAKEPMPDTATNQ